MDDKTDSTAADALPPEGTDERPGTQGHDQPVPPAYAAFMRQGWGERELDLPPHPVAQWAAQRRARLAETFPGERLVVPAGNFKVRANDTDYRFRPDTAHTHLTGNQTSDAVLVVENGEAVLYARPRSSRQTDEFFRDRQYGELWAGRRPSLNEMQSSLGVTCRHIAELPAELKASGKVRVLRNIDATAMMSTMNTSSPMNTSDGVLLMRRFFFARGDVWGEPARVDCLFLLLDMSCRPPVTAVTESPALRQPHAAGRRA